MRMDRRGFLRQSSGILAGLPLVTGGFGQRLYANQVDGLSRQPEDISDRVLRKIAIGSCNRQNAPQSHWPIIGQDNPDLWIWLGDNIYADHTSISGRENEYRKLKDQAGYKEFRLKTPITGIWDDHDFASDNQGGAFSDKVASQKLFMDFMDLPDYHALRDQQGIYRSHIFGPIGQQTHLILLDVRFFRPNPLTRQSSLGEQQWEWLESQILSSQSDLMIITSGLHVTGRFTGFGLEGWNQFPEDRRRLYELLSQTDKPVLLLSGDRHMAEFATETLDSGKVIYEMMASGMTHSSNFAIPGVNRIGSIVGRKNYGLIQIDWSGNEPNLLLEIKSTERQETYSRLVPDFSGNQRFKSFSSTLTQQSR